MLAGVLAGVLGLCLAHGPAASQTPQMPQVPLVTAFSAATGTQPPAPWQLAGLPAGKAPLADMQVLPVDGLPGPAVALRMRTQASYGTVVHPIPHYVPGPQAMLAWQWRLDEPVAGADLRQRQGDDSALKLCLMFDMPLERIGLWERSLLRMARAASGQPLPAATLCYVWDPTLPAGTLLPNAYSARVRFMVLDGLQAPLRQWRQHQRPIAADFLRAFGDESPQVPPLTAIVAGADSDNTGHASTAWVGDITLKP